MITIRAFLLAFLGLAVLPSSYAADDARAAIEAANAKFSEAFARGDAKALAAMYTTDAIAFPPDSEMIRGNEAIGAFWKGAHDSGVKGAVPKATEVEVSGTTAFEVGTVTVTMQPDAAKPATTMVAKYLVVWKRQADGAWKLHRDIWNSLPPAK